MESRPTGNELGIEPESAADALRRGRAVRTSARQRGPSRGFQVLLIASALFLSLYAWAFMVYFSAVNGGGGSAAFFALLVFPSLCFSGLAAGARERFGVRSRSSRGSFVSAAIVLVVLVPAVAFLLRGEQVPTWLLGVAPVVIFVALAAGPIRQLARSGGRGAPAERWSNPPMRTPPRIMTGVLGVYLGFLTAASALPGFTIVIACSVALMFLPIIARRTEWGLEAMGYDWGALQWVAFGLVASVMLVLAVGSAGGPVPPAAAAAAGAFICVLLVVVAVLPRGRRGER